MSELVYTDSVFNVIGDHPVLDQFDVLYTGLLTGSMNDRYITGSLFSRDAFADIFGNISLTLGERGLAFSKLNKNRNITPGSDTSYELQPWSERAGIVRNTRIFSRSERYYDSLTPFYDKMIFKLGGSTLTGSFPLKSINFSIGPVDTLNFTAVGFQETFPFEPKFETIDRSKKILNDYEKLPIIIWEDGEDVFSIKLRWVNSWDPITPTASGLLSEDIGKIFFGFGDRRKLYEESPGTFRSRSNLPDYRENTLQASAYNIVSPVIRGWKYGLISASPYFTSAVFRRDRYGQHRDMLEQRPSVVSVVDKTYSPMRYVGDVEKPAFFSIPFGVDTENPGEDPPTDFVVKVAFSKLALVQKLSIVSGTIGDFLEYVNLSPEETDSSNLSTFVTSSLPFFDA